MVDTREGHGQGSASCPFRFLATWQGHVEFPRFIKGAWPRSKDLHEGLMQFREAVSIWNREVFGNIHRRKARTMARLGGIQRSLQNFHNPFLRSLEVRLEKELEVILAQEELLWFQKSRGN